MDFKVDKFSTFYEGESGKLDSFSCANTGKDSIVTDKAYYWNGQYLKKSGTYVAAFVNSTGCDSVVTLKLTSTCANTGKDSIVTDKAYYVWHGDSLKTSGTFIDTFVNVKGCDSVVTLKLTLKASCDNTGKDSIVTDKTYYVWGGDTLRTSGTYIDTFVNIHGCDSVVTLKLTFKTSGIAGEDVSSSIRVYPNPSDGLFTINTGQNGGTISYTISSIDGRTIRQKQNVSDRTTAIDLSREDSGIYFLKVAGDNYIRVFKLVKQ